MALFKEKAEVLEKEERIDYSMAETEKKEKEKEKKEKDKDKGSVEL